jgi:hypothetical protein
VQNQYIQYRRDIQSSNRVLATDFSNTIDKFKNSGDLGAEIDTVDASCIKIMGGRYGFAPALCDMLKGMSNAGDVSRNNPCRYG